MAMVILPELSRPEESEESEETSVTIVVVEGEEGYSKGRTFERCAGVVGLDQLDDGSMASDDGR